MIIKQIIFCICLLMALVSGAQVSADAEFRINPVYSRGYRQPLYDGEKPGFYTMQRTRLIINYTKEMDLVSEVILQDRRFWGDQNVRADVPNIAVFRAWVEKYFTPEISLKLGRQGLIYDDKYIFGELNWGGTLAHDAALLKYESDFGKIHFAAEYNTNADELKRDHYVYTMPKTMQFVWMHKEFGPLSTSVMFVNHGLETADTVVHYTETIGTENTLKVNDALSLKGIYYYQVGQDIESRSVHAYLMSVQAIIEVSDNVSFNIGSDIVSGTNESRLNDPENTKSSSFNRYFGQIHAQFGYLDYFFVNQPTNQGIYDYYLKGSVKTGKLTLNNDVHAFRSDKTILNENTEVPLKKFLGVENDFTVDYKFSNIYKATLGHSIMFGTSTLDHFFGGTPIKESQFFYAVITAKPKLF